MKQNLLVFFLLALIVVLPADFILERLRESVFPLPIVRQARTESESATFQAATPLEIRGEPVTHVEPPVTDAVCGTDEEVPEDLDVLDYSVAP